MPDEQPDRNKKAPNRAIAVAVTFVLLVGGCLLRWAGVLERKVEIKRRAQCLNSLRAIGFAFHLYAGDNGGRFPTDAANTTLGSLARLMTAYQSSYKLWLCPSDAGVIPGSRHQPFTAKNLSYAYGAFGLTESVQPDTPIACDRSSGDIRSVRPWEGNRWTHRSAGGNVLFANGHVAFTQSLDPPMYRGKNP